MLHAQGFIVPDAGIYQAFYQYEPNDLIGHSILLFDHQALITRTRAPLPLKLRQLVGLATNAAPIDSCP